MSGAAGDQDDPQRVVGTRSVAWAKDEPLGVEFAEIEIRPDRLAARGVAIGSAPVAYRLDYQLRTGARFVTSRMHVSSRGEGWRRELDLRRDRYGVWSIATEGEGEVDLPAAGGDAISLAGALDADLELSPLTNMMPILRHAVVRGGGPIDFTMAWVAVPALTVQADKQRYRHLNSSGDHHVVRYEAIDGSFAADIELDADAVVIDYPGIAHRLGS